MSPEVEKLTKRINHLRSQRTGVRQPDLELVIEDAERERARIILLEDEAKKPLPPLETNLECDDPECPWCDND